MLETASRTMISTELKCIYIHIPKTGGTSIESKLGFHNGEEIARHQDHRRYRNLESSVWPPSRGAWSPMSFLRFGFQRIRGVQEGFDFPSAADLDSFYKFAIVRNPWDRVYSWYRNVMRDENHQAELGVNSQCGFGDFITNHLDTWAMNSQLDWLIDSDGEMAMDYVGKFETLQESFDEIGKALGFDDTQLPVLLHSGKTDYRGAYEAKLVDKIADRYAREIEYFEYSFE